MPSQRIRFDDDPHPCLDLDHLSRRLSDPSEAFAPGDELDARLVDIAVPDGFLERLRNLAADATVEAQLIGVDLPDGCVQRLRRAPVESSTGDAWNSLPLSS